MHQHAVVGNLDLAGFLLLGLIGSTAHCAAMCSPFVLLVSSRYARPNADRSVPAAQAWYAAGRIATYAALGAAAGVLGGAFQTAGLLLGVHRAAAGVAGAALLVWALAGLFSRHLTFGLPAEWLSAVTRRLHRHVPGHPLVAGLVLGLLPCGLLYTAVVGAVARGGPLPGATALMAFGAGTVPALFGVAFANEFVFRRRPVINHVAHVFVLCMGLWYLWSGLV